MPKSQTPFNRATPRLAVLAALFAVGPLLAQDAGDRNLVGAPAPALSRPDLQHRQISLSAYRGKVVLLNFWATWCGPCKVEIPEFLQWQKTYGPKGLQVLGVSMDDGTPEVLSTVARMHIDYPVVMGDGKLGNTWGGVEGLPVTFLIDRHGKVIGRYGSTDLPRLQGEITRLLNTR